MGEGGRPSRRQTRQRLYTCQNAEGFTLVELVVTLGLLVILAGVSIFGLVAWQDHSRLEQENSYAAVLYLAAQEQLSRYGRSGQLMELQERISQGQGYVREISAEELTDSLGNPLKSSDVWQQGEGVLCYALCAKGDYAAYLAGALSDEAKEYGADIVFMLLEDCVYDASILNQNISIEFNPEGGQVFSVCCSDREGQFVYGEAGAGQVDVRNREESYLRDHMIGCYGGGVLVGNAEK